MRVDYVLPCLSALHPVLNGRVFFYTDYRIRKYFDFSIGDKSCIFNGNTLSHKIVEGAGTMKRLLTMNELSISEMEEILADAERFANGAIWRPEEQTMVANLFFEPSTRTKSSFEMAERKLGLEVIPFDPGASSVLKGETLYDTARTFESIGVKALVIRHVEDNYFNQLIGKNLNIPIINAGDGCGNHPTQSLLDLLTIKQEFKEFKDLKIAIIGDITHSRVARSNAVALTRLGAKVVFSGPPEWFDENSGLGEYEDIDQAITTSDVVMLLRIQHERHEATCRNCRLPRAIWLNKKTRTNDEAKCDYYASSSN